MKIKFLLFILCCLGFDSAKSQADFPLPLSHHQLSLDFGSLRNRYLYPITHLQYSSPVLDKLPLRFSGRLRSYGTLYLFSRSAYDLSGQAEYVIGGSEKFRLAAGAGLDLRVRLVKDIRSDAKTSLEPYLHFAAYGQINRFLYTLPLQLRFYSNGLGAGVSPQLSYTMAQNRLAVFLRLELTLLAAFNPNTTEWRRDTFAGLAWIF